MSRHPPFAPTLIALAVQLHIFELRHAREKSR